MNTNTESDYESEIERDIDDIDMDEVMGCSCGQIVSIYNEYGLFSGTCPKCGETWGNPTFELPQDCFNIVKDYMGIVSVPTPIWNAMLNQPIKHLYCIDELGYEFQGETPKEIQQELDRPACIASREKGLHYWKPFPKGTDLRKVSKKEKITRYIVGLITNNIERLQYDPLPNAEYLQKLRKSYIQQTKEQSHLWGDYCNEVTDFSMYMFRELIRCELEYVYIRLCKFNYCPNTTTNSRIKMQKQKKVNDNSWVNDFNVNEEVVVYHDGIYRKAIVKKNNKASVSVLLAMYREEDDLNAIKNQTYGYNKLIWGGWCLKTIPIKSRSRLYKKGDGWKYDENIIEGSRRVDYGN
jgi:hypothetical protein